VPFIFPDNCENLLNITSILPYFSNPINLLLRT